MPSMPAVSAPSLFAARAEAAHPETPGRCRRLFQQQPRPHTRRCAPRSAGMKARERSERTSERTTGSKPTSGGGARGARRTCREGARRRSKQGPARRGLPTRRGRPPGSCKHRRVAPRWPHLRQHWTPPRYICCGTGRAAVGAQYRTRIIPHGVIWTYVVWAAPCARTELWPSAVVRQCTRRNAVLATNGYSTSSSRKMSACTAAACRDLRGMMA